MKLSTRPRYALRLMMDIARYSKEGNPVHLRDIATRNNLSKGYLEQLVGSLRNAQLLRSFSGRGGGYMLVRPPEQVSLLEIIEATIGPINVVDCVAHPEECMNAEYCECRSLWDLLNGRITGLLGGFSLEDLSERGGIRRITKERDGKADDGPLAIKQP